MNEFEFSVCHTWVLNRIVDGDLPTLGRPRNPHEMNKTRLLQSASSLCLFLCLAGCNDSISSTHASEQQIHSEIDIKERHELTLQLKELLERLDELDVEMAGLDSKRQNAGPCHLTQQWNDRRNRAYNQTSLLLFNCLDADSGQIFDIDELEDSPFTWQRVRGDRSIAMAQARAHLPRLQDETRLLGSQLDAMFNGIARR